MLKGLFQTASALLLGAAFATAAHADDAFVAGKHYFAIEPPQATASDKPEVVEVFSYACPACNLFQPTMRKLKAELPAGTELLYLPAGFRPDEDWPVFQRAFYTAQALGILDKSHDATFDLVWKDEGTLRISDANTHKPMNPMPSIEDVAKAYAQFGVKADEFTATANSFAINTKVKRADAMLKAYGVDSTPTLVVDGRYRLTVASAGGVDKVLPLIKFLIEKDRAAR